MNNMIDAANGAYGIEDFIADAKKIVAPEGSDPGESGRRELGRCLRRLAQNPAIVERTGTSTNPRQGTHGMDIRGGEIHKEPDGTLALMLARFPHESETPIHNHNSWGVVCVVAGRDRYVAWQRVDDASRSGHAQVKIAWERVLDPGDVVDFADSPDDIHSQQGVGAPVWELVFFGRDPNVKPRLYFDAKEETVRAAPAMKG
jgi:predicted metal-dependent enzyme (double-stranded beta helix superfamily)